MLTLFKNLITHHLRIATILLFGLLIVIMSVTFYVTSHSQSHGALENEANEAILRSAKQAALNIETQIEGNFALLETIANRYIIKGKFGDKNASMEERIETLKYEQQRLSQYGFKRFGISDTEGIAFFTSGRKLFLGDKENFIKALNGEKSISSVFVSQYEKEPIYFYTVARNT